MYAPSEEGRYKVYIVDEAHMLTREAWNALLKILEEPPSRVIFIFATTEPQKIQQSAAPILSRCQRFDFRRIGVSDIAGRLREVLAIEGISASEDALRTIGRRAEGGMRDGLSLLDQVLALSGGEVSQEAVRRVLGLVEEERYLELLDILVGRRPGEVFTFLESLLDEGYDLTEFYHGWVDILRTVLRLRLGGPAPDVREDLIAAFRTRGDAFSAGDLVRMLSLSSELESTGSLKRTGNPRLLLEMLLLRLAYLDRTVELEALIRQLGGGAPVPERGGGGPAPSGPPAGRSGAPIASTPAPRTQPAAPARRGAPTGATETRELVGSEADAPPSRASGVASVAQPLGAAPASTRSANLDTAWKALLGSGRSVPTGMGLFLRTAAVREDPPGSVRVSLAHGPARERLGDPMVVRALSDALSEELGRRVQLFLDSVDEGTVKASEGTSRVTPENVRQGRLRELLALEPLLGPVVQSLDLELLE
jgi:DNA polymerase-3 subunit gamma/tau